jgi:hypothetical protein
MRYQCRLVKASEFGKKVFTTPTSMINGTITANSHSPANLALDGFSPDDLVKLTTQKAARIIRSHGMNWRSSIGFTSASSPAKAVSHPIIS